MPKSYSEAITQEEQSDLVAATYKKILSNSIWIIRALWHHLFASLY